MYFSNFQEAIAHATAALMKRGVEVDAGSWQGYKTEGKPDLVTLELMNLSFEVPVDRIYQDPESRYRNDPMTFFMPDVLSPALALEIQPNLPWANDHFAERVSRDPSNPGEEYKNWPWWRGQVDTTQEQGVFSHTYQERFWAADAWLNQHAGEYPTLARSTNMGIRYDYGDLDDVVTLLYENPHTRQATFPIFFPEDTGAVHGGRIPCTLHYHFLLRENRLHMWYPIRSCDLVRHFRDDLYMACKLLLWVIAELQERELRGDNPQLWVDVRPGTLFFTAYSFHVHKGDIHHVKH